MDKEEILLLAQDVFDFKEALRNLTNACVIPQDNDKQTIKSFVHEHVTRALRILAKLLTKYPELQSTEMLIKAQNLIHFAQSFGTKLPDESFGINDFVNQLATSFSIRVSAYLMCEQELQFIDREISHPVIKTDESTLFSDSLEEQFGENGDVDGVGEEGGHVPPAVATCIRAVERHGIHIKGIYRVSSVRSRVEPLCRALESSDAGRPLATDEQALLREPHVVANALKLYLRRMPEPLLTSRLYPYFIRLARDDRPESERARHLRQLVRRLPLGNRATAAALARHLSRVAAADNNMSAANLGIVFGPTLLGGPPLDAVHQAQIVRLLVAESNMIFGDDCGGPADGSDAADL